MEGQKGIGDQSVLKRFQPYQGEKFMEKIRFFKSFWILSLASFLYLLLPPSEVHCRVKLKVVASLFPLYEFAREVGANHSEVTLLLPPGGEAHSWEPKPGDIAKIAKADVFVYLGVSMEPWVDKVLKATRGKQVRVVEASHGLHLLKAEHHEKEHGKPGHSQGHSHGENLDPHIWLDFHLDLEIVEAIARAFAEKDPAHQSAYSKNAEVYQGRLKDLDRIYRTSLANCRHRQMILGGHAAFAYLAKRYGLEQLSLSGVSPNAEPTPKRMAEVIEVTRKAGNKYIFSEEMVNAKLAQALAREAGVSILVLNPGANLTRQQAKDKVTFIELMESNLKKLKKGLECGD
jgi:zinc transport system substrate-binding protein